jgi:hypothetical protein
VLKILHAIKVASLRWQPLPALMRGGRVLSHSPKGDTVRRNGILRVWIILVLGGFAASALSAEVRSPDPSTRANATALAAQQAPRAAAQEILMVEGTISRVDPHTGQVEVQTSEGVSALSFAPHAVKALQVGQPVVVELVPRHE